MLTETLLSKNDGGMVPQVLHHNGGTPSCSNTDKAAGDSVMAAYQELDWDVTDGAPEGSRGRAPAQCQGPP